MTSGCHRVDAHAYLPPLTREIALLVDAASDLDPAAPVPSCPDWSATDLFDHVGSVHRWVEHQVRLVTPVRIPSSEMGIVPPTDPKGFAGWVAEGGERLLATLAAAEPDAEMWAWGEDKHVRFWPRRMIHETTVHRADADLAAERDPVIDPGVAIDGIDEFLDNLPCAEYFAPKVAELAGNGEVLRIGCTDVGTEWFITLNADGFVWSHDGAGAEASVEGSAADLYLFSWGRRKIGESDRLKVSGDQVLLDRWVENSAL